MFDHKKGLTEAMTADLRQLTQKETTTRRFSLQNSTKGLPDGCQMPRVSNSVVLIH